MRGKVKQYDVLITFTDGSSTISKGWWGTRDLGRRLKKTFRDVKSFSIINGG